MKTPRGVNGKTNYGNSGRLKKKCIYLKSTAKSGMIRDVFTIHNFFSEMKQI